MSARNYDYDRNNGYDFDYDRNYDRGYDYRRGGAPSHMRAPEPRKSRTAALIVAAALVAALGGAGAMFALTANHGSVQADAAAASQAAQVQQASSAKQTSDAKLAQYRAENAQKAAEQQAAQERAAREQAEAAQRAAAEQAEQERAAREQAEQERAAAEQAAAEQAAQEKAAEGYSYKQRRSRDFALSIFAKDGQATNVTVSEIAQSGGFNSCYVEFDKAGFHYTVRVNTDCHMIVYGMATDGNTEVSFDDDGTVLNGLTSDGDFLTKSQVLARM